MAARNLTWSFKNFSRYPARFRNIHLEYFSKELQGSSGKMFHKSVHQSLRATKFVEGNIKNRIRVGKHLVWATIFVLNNARETISKPTSFQGILTIITAHVLGQHMWLNLAPIPSASKHWMFMFKVNTLSAWDSHWRNWIQRKIKE